MAEKKHPQLTTLIISPSDLKQAVRHLETVDDYLHQASLRKGGEPTALPRANRLIKEIASETDTNLLNPADRKRLKKYLEDLNERAPVLHISFASEPSAAFMAKLIVWLRTNIHPEVVVRLGLQPSIAAGCIVRTPNKMFDFSLAQALDKQRQQLMVSLKGDDAGVPSFPVSSSALSAGPTVPVAVSAPTKSISVVEEPS